MPRGHSEEVRVLPTFLLFFCSLSLIGKAAGLYPVATDNWLIGVRVPEGAPYAAVVKSVDTSDLKSAVDRLTGSSPVSGTIIIFFERGIKMKVYVITSAKPMEPEVYEGVAKSFKEAERFIKSCFPNARRDDQQVNRAYTSYSCKDRFGNWSIMFIHEEELS